MSDVKSGEVGEVFLGLKLAENAGAVGWFIAVGRLDEAQARGCFLGGGPGRKGKGGELVPVVLKDATFVAKLRCAVGAVEGVPSERWFGRVWWWAVDVGAVGAVP